MEREYEVWHDPTLHVRIILEERKARSGMRYALVVKAPGVTVILAVPANIYGPKSNNTYNMIEPITQLSPGSYRVDQETEDTLLAAWGLR